MSRYTIDNSEKTTEEWNKAYTNHDCNKIIADNDTNTNNNSEITNNDKTTENCNYNDFDKTTDNSNYNDINEKYTLSMHVDWTTIL